MASTTNTKFSTLPDIDLTAIDVYETSSSPELKPKRGGGADLKSSRRHRTGGQGDTSDSDEEDDDDISDHGEGATSSRRKTQQQQSGQQAGEIDQQQVDAEEAMRRFQDSVGMEGGSGGTKKNKKKSKKTTGDNLESEVESPAQKLRRLKREMNQLQEELQATGSSSNSIAANGQQGGEQPTQQTPSQNEPSPEVLIEQLRSLKLDLGKLDGSDETDGQEQQRLLQARKLLDSLQNPRTTPADTTKSHSASSPIPPAQALAVYESRLSHLETLIGSNQSVLEESQSLARPLLPTVSRLEQLAALLTQPRHIDAVSKRVKVLVSELDRVYDSRKRLASLPNDGPSGGASADSESGQEQTRQQTSQLDPISLSKLDDLFHLSTRIQPLLPLAPQLLQRLRSLATLHASASQFASSLEQLQEEQQEIITTQTQFQAALSQVEKSIQDNNERTRANLDVVMNRLEDVEKRVRAL